MTQRTTFPSEPIDLRLVVTDLDGTLLDADGSLPERLWPLLDELAERGAMLVPASGRQYRSLVELFGRRSRGLAFIAENGTYVVRDGNEVSCSPLAAGVGLTVVDTVRELAGDGVDAGVVWCGRRTAYIERSDPGFVAQVATYYASVELVADLDDVGEEAIKCAVHCGDGATGGVAAALADRCAPHQVVVSSPHWIDVMSAGVNKGAALASLQASLGITPEQTLVFGDYLNDLEMLAASPYSFAMANAHPEAIEAARFVAPPNHEQGVVTVIERVLAALAA